MNIVYIKYTTTSGKQNFSYIFKAYVCFHEGNSQLFFFFFFRFDPQLIDLKSQLRYFANLERQLIQKLGDAEAKALLLRAVYLIGIGSNDYAAAVSGNSSVSPEEYVNMVNGNLTFVIRVIKLTMFYIFKFTSFYLSYLDCCFYS